MLYLPSGNFSLAFARRAGKAKWSLFAPGESHRGSVVSFSFGFCVLAQNRFVPEGRQGSVGDMAPGGRLGYTLRMGESTEERNRPIPNLGLDMEEDDGYRR
jgi:hypothetical protein